MKHQRRKKPKGKDTSKLPIEHTGFYLYLQRYLEARLVKGTSAYTLGRHENMLRQFIVWCEERELDDPREITRPILERYQKHLYYHRKANGEPLSFGAQNTQLSCIKQFFSWLTKQNYLLYNPAADLELPKRPKRLPRSLLSIDDVQSLFNNADLTTVSGVRDRALMELLYSCGLRRSEAANLALQDIDIKRQTLLVRSGKGNKDRFLPIGDSANQWLEKYLIDARGELLIDPRETTLFISNYGEPFTGDAMGRMIKRRMVKVGIDLTGSAHLFRHAMATHMLDNGADIRYIQAMLGHANLNTTEIYTQVSIEKLRKIHRATHPAKGKRGDDENDNGE